MASATTPKTSVKAAPAADARVDELRKDMTALLKELDKLRKKVAALEAAPAPAASGDKKEFVTRNEWQNWRRKVAKKIGLRL